MLDINGKERDFNFEELGARGKCMVCKDILPKGTKVMRLPAPQYKQISVCADCLHILSEISNGENNYGFSEEELKYGISLNLE